MTPQATLNAMIATHEQLQPYIPGDVWQKQYTRMRELLKTLNNTSNPVDSSANRVSTMSTRMVATPP